MGEEWWIDDEGDEKQALRTKFTNSDNEDNLDRDRCTEFNEQTDMKDPHFEIDMEFTNYKIFTETIKEFNIKGGYDIV